MQFSIGDKVVHPRRGPGRIVDVERQSFLDEAKRYYVIDMPASALTVRIPVRRVDEVGLRPAMTRKKLARVLEILHGRPRGLPADHKERQERVRERVQTARPIRMAEAVRDLTWHGRMAHLTKIPYDDIVKEIEKQAKTHYAYAMVSPVFRQKPTFLVKKWTTQAKE